MFKVLGHAQDLKSGAKIIYCQTTPSKYLEIIGDDFRNFEMQRKKEKHKGYIRLKKDIEDGALLPSITLAVKQESVKPILDKLNADIKDDDLALELSSNTIEVDILDGLQRTYILDDLKQDKFLFKEGQTLLLEFWLDEDLQNVVYRMIVLNSGQKKMSMRHQIDLLFSTTKKTIEDRLPGIQLFTEKDTITRKNSKQYSLHTIAGAYYSFLRGSPVKDLDYIINDRIDDEILDNSSEKIKDDFNSFIEILQLFIKIDELSWKIYHTADEQSKDKRKYYNWLGSENVLLSFFAAVGLMLQNNKKDAVLNSLNKIKTDLKNLDQQDKITDYFSINEYFDLVEKINSKTVNVGNEQRKYIFVMFKDYFKNEGQLPFESSWRMSAL
ncbi:unnamed protein product [Commensalibacter communis]|uniref:hypothetical protein n=1 Tax=Commensalibacter communis TaxID=2972786 RepID=UPI0022FFC3AD|nr:hypothetical protein [Commensalibacter communis]CAI3956061.1 unnamed protein product [Commensalibacter communis]CAI3956846.1 unnamed protein product [Commensalibacter communis]